MGLSTDTVIELFSIYLIFSVSLWLWGVPSFWQKSVPDNICGDKVRPACNADNLSSIFQLSRQWGILHISQKASTAC
jgi:hypothetical protein